MAGAAAQETGSSEEEESEANEERRDEDDGTCAVDLYFCEHVVEVAVGEVGDQPGGIGLHVGTD